MKYSKSILAVTLAFGGLVATLPALAQDPQSPATTNAQVSPGEYLARAGNCVACHSIPDGAPYSGGLKMAVPGYGFIYSTNITPDPETGIGTYTFENFNAAM